jgi:putative FmdB family regulatory protein
MPIYEYTCAACRRDLEVIQKITDPPLVQCPACGEASLRKKTSIAAFHLKGGGWFKDGYGKSGEKSETGPASSTATKTEVGTEPPATPAKESIPAAKETSAGAAAS